MIISQKTDKGLSGVSRYARFISLRGDEDNIVHRRIDEFIRKCPCSVVLLADTFNELEAPGRANIAA